MRMRFTKRGKAFVVRNVYIHVTTDWVNRDKAVLPEFVPKECRPHSETSGRFLRDRHARCEYSILDTDYVYSYILSLFKLFESIGGANPRVWVRKNIQATRLTGALTRSVSAWSQLVRSGVL